MALQLFNYNLPKRLIRYIINKVSTDYSIRELFQHIYQSHDSQMIPGRHANIFKDLHPIGLIEKSLRSPKYKSEIPFLFFRCLLVNQLFSCFRISGFGQNFSLTFGLFEVVNALFPSRLGFTLFGLNE